MDVGNADDEALSGFGPRATLSSLRCVSSYLLDTQERETDMQENEDISEWGMGRGKGPENEITRAWAKLDPDIAQARKTVDEGQYRGPNAVRYTIRPGVTAYDLKAFGFSPALVDAIMLLQKCVERGMPPQTESQA
jgi:hypothetical protein